MLPLETYIKALETALKSAQKYDRSLIPIISATASDMRIVALCDAEIDNLDSTTIDSPQGLKAHPVFKTRKDASDSLGRRLKQLGLTYEDLGELDGSDDRLIALTKKVQQAGSRGKVVYPETKKTDDR